MYLNKVSRKRKNAKSYYKKEKKTIKKFKLYKAPISAVMPDVIRRKLFYNAEIVIDAGIASFITHKFRANSLYDPDYTGTGHQPYGFDQYHLLYKENRVLNAKLSITKTNTAITDNIPGFIGIIVSPDVTTPTFSDASHFIEMAKSQGWPVKSTGSFHETLDDAFRTLLSANWNAKQRFGPGADEESQRGSATSGPPSEQYFIIVAYCIQGANNPAPMSLSVDIEFDALFMKPLLLPQS